MTNENKSALSVLIIAVIASGAWLIIEESAGHMMDMGKSYYQAFAASATFYVGALILAGIKTNTRYLRIAIVLCIEIAMIASAAIHEGKPLVEKRLAGPTLKLAESYKKEIASLEIELDRKAANAKAFGKNNPINLSRVDKKQDELAAKLEAARQNYNTLLTSASVSKSGWATLKVLIFWRSVLSALNLFLAWYLGEIWAQKSQIGRNWAANPPETEPATRLMPQKLPREIVQAAVPGADCRSINGTKSGPFEVYFENVRLGTGPTSYKAWEAAAKNCLPAERRAA